MQVSNLVPSKTSASLVVAVRCRPVLKAESAKKKDGVPRGIVRVVDNRFVVVLDPDESKDYLDAVQNRTKEKRYTFDIAFDVESSNDGVYQGTVRDLVDGVVHGINATVFAYGATGSGKTYTMVGTSQDPGLMVLAGKQLFEELQKRKSCDEATIVCSYLEVYNEVIYDLLTSSNASLELREDPESGVNVAGLRGVPVSSCAEIMNLLEEGNKRRKTETTDANAASSRSHAVLEIKIKRKGRHGYNVPIVSGKLSMVDLAGSERASETNNAGQKLRDGANINRSLLALANCINALGKQQKNGITYVPYRNSKLTRLLKDGLSGNSRTAMIATVAAAADQYHHTINTLKYADRAKEIKTHVVQNVGSVESHVTEYKKIIDRLQVEVQQLRAQLGEAGPSRDLPGNSADRLADSDDEIGWLEDLAGETAENVEERINLQKQVLELQEVLNRHRRELTKQASQSGEDIDALMCELEEDYQETQEALERVQQDIQTNEASRRTLQERLHRAMSNVKSQAVKKTLTAFQLQSVQLQELKFQVAIRDQVISEQRTAAANLWRLVQVAGVDREQLEALAQQEGITLEGWIAEERNTLTPERLDRVAAHVANSTMDHSDSDMQELLPQEHMHKHKYKYKFWSHYSENTAPGQESLEWATGRREEQDMPPAENRGNIRVPSTHIGSHRSPYKLGVRKVQNSHHPHHYSNHHAHAHGHTYAASNAATHTAANVAANTVSNGASISASNGSLNSGSSIGASISGTHHRSQSTSNPRSNYASSPIHGHSNIPMAPPHSLQSSTSPQTSPQGVAPTLQSHPLTRKSAQAHSQLSPQRVVTHATSAHVSPQGRSLIPGPTIHNHPHNLSQVNHGSSTTRSLKDYPIHPRSLTHNVNRPHTHLEQPNTTDLDVRASASSTLSFTLSQTSTAVGGQRAALVLSPRDAAAAVDPLGSAGKGAPLQRRHTFDQAGFGQAIEPRVVLAGRRGSSQEEEIRTKSSAHSHLDLPTSPRECESLPDVSWQEGDGQMAGSAASITDKLSRLKVGRMARISSASITAGSTLGVTRAGFEAGKLEVPGESSLQHPHQKLHAGGDQESFRSQSETASRHKSVMLQQWRQQQLEQLKARHQGA